MCLYMYRRNRPGCDSKVLDTMSSSDSDTYSERNMIAVPPYLSFEVVLANKKLPVGLRLLYTPPVTMNDLPSLIPSNLKASLRMA